VEAAIRAQTKRLALFHYDQDYSDHDVDELVARVAANSMNVGLARSKF